MICENGLDLVLRRPLCRHVETILITTQVKTPDVKKNVCVQSWSGARHQPDVGCHVASRVRANVEGFQAVGEHVVNGRIPQLPRHKPHEGQHVQMEDTLEQFACK